MSLAEDMKLIRDTLRLEGMSGLMRLPILHQYTDTNNTISFQLRNYPDIFFKNTPYNGWKFSWTEKASPEEQIRVAWEVASTIEHIDVGVSEAYFKVRPWGHFRMEVLSTWCECDLRWVRTPWDGYSVLWGRIP